RRPADNTGMLRSAHILQLAVVALLGVGVVMVHSASLRVGATDPAAGPEAWLLAAFAGRNTIYALLAIAVMLAASRINVRQLFRTHGWTNPLWLILGLSLVLAALTLVPTLGKSVNGASRWLHLGPAGWGLTFQPSELVKWVMVVAIAWWCARRR